MCAFLEAAFPLTPETTRHTFSLARGVQVSCNTYFFNQTDLSCGFLRPALHHAAGLTHFRFWRLPTFALLGDLYRNRTCALLLLKQSLFLTELKVGFGYRCAAGIVQPPFERQNAIHLQYAFLRFVLTLSLRPDAALACSARTYHPLTALLSFASVLRAV